MSNTIRLKPPGRNLAVLVARAAAETAHGLTGTNLMVVSHDEWRRSLVTQSMFDCRCSPEMKIPPPWAPRRNLGNGTPTQHPKTTRQSGGIVPRTCTICNHTDKEAINQELVNGTAFRHIAERTGTSTTALQRHKKEHMPVSLALAKEAGDVAQADDLLAKLVSLQDKALNILGQAEQCGDLRTALMAVREVRATMELVGKVTGELNNKREVDVKVYGRFVIGTGYGEPEEPEAPGRGSRVVNGHVVDGLPPRVRAE